MKHIKLTAILCLALSACATPEPIVMKDAPVVIPIVEPVSVVPVNWQILTPKQATLMLAKQNPTTMLYILDEQSYKNAIVNLIDIKRYITEQNEVTKMLKEIIAERTAK